MKWEMKENFEKNAILISVQWITEYIYLERCYKYSPKTNTVKLEQNNRIGHNNKLLRPMKWHLYVTTYITAYTDMLQKISTKVKRFNDIH